MAQPKLSRRAALRGLGTVVALPWLESLATAAAPAAKAAAVAGPPRRLAFLYVPNGVNMEGWTPKAAGTLVPADLPATLKPLAPYTDSVNVLGGLTLDKARANGDGGGDHARAMSAFLTGRQPRKTNGSDIKVGMSADQHVATAIGDSTRFPSLELGIERGAQAGNCDSGYSCAYSSNLSWRGEATPNAKETDPKAVFDRLFAGTDPTELAAARAKRDKYNRSVLDFVLEDAKQLNQSLGQSDRRKMDEYLAAVREVEDRIDKMKKALADRKQVAKPDIKFPANPQAEFQDHARLMLDLLVLSFQTDLTRVITLPLANDGSNRPYKAVGVPDGHHDLSHHGRNGEKLAKIQKINMHHTEQLAYLLGKMKGVKEANGSSLLDNAMVVYGSGIGDGDRHNHDDLPILLCGKGGGSVQGGRHLRFSRETPLMNLYLALFERMGAPADRFGDSTGRLSL